MSRLKHIVSGLLRRIAPPLWMSIHARRLLDKTSEYEARLLPLMVSPGEASIDVGANIGDYAYHLRALSSRVFAFEPNPALAAWLRGCYGRTVTVIEAALSDAAGTAELSIPLGDTGELIDGHGSIENTFGVNSRTVSVPLIRLDDMDLPKIGFLKIDVEGHELIALRGARRLLQRDRPTLLVEIEERHRKNAVRSMAEFLSEFGYQGFFVKGQTAHPIAAFDADALQNPRYVDSSPTDAEVYINNFIFVAREDARQRLLNGLSDVARRAG